MSEETYGENLACPFCGCINRDAWDLGSGGEECGEVDCDFCEREYTYARMVHVTYRAWATKEQQALGGTE